MTKRHKDLHVVASTMYLAKSVTPTVVRHFKYVDGAYVVLFAEGSNYTIHSIEEWNRITGQDK